MYNTFAYPQLSLHSLIPVSKYLASMATNKLLIYQNTKSYHEHNQLIIHIPHFTKNILINCILYIHKSYSHKDIFQAYNFHRMEGIYYLYLLLLKILNLYFFT